MFNCIDNYSFISVSGCVCMGPSALLFPRQIILLRLPCLHVHNILFLFVTFETVSTGIPVSFASNTNRMDKTEILLVVALDTCKLSKNFV